MFYHWIVHWWFSQSAPRARPLKNKSAAKIFYVTYFEPLLRAIFIVRMQGIRLFTPPEKDLRRSLVIEYLVNPIQFQFFNLYRLNKLLLRIFIIMILIFDINIWKWKHLNIFICTITRIKNFEQSKNRSNLMKFDFKIWFFFIYYYFFLFLTSYIYISKKNKTLVCEIFFRYR